MTEHLAVLAGLFTLAGVGFRYLYLPDLLRAPADTFETVDRLSNVTD